MKRTTLRPVSAKRLALLRQEGGSLRRTALKAGPGEAMSQYEPTKPYVYQPGAPTRANPDRIFGVSGPGAEVFSECRLTRVEADALLRLLLLFGATRP